MLVDPVFSTLTDYKKEFKEDVIRHELAIRAEILRCKQYRKHAYGDDHKFVIDNIINVMTKDLNAVLRLLPAYLDYKFKEEVKRTNFWERGALKANYLNWKYTFYVTQRNEIAVELADLLRDKAKVSIRQVKESAS